MKNPYASRPSMRIRARIGAVAVRCAAALAAAIALASCGGQVPLAGSDLSPSGRATITILWPARSRLVPEVCESIRVGVRAGSGVTLNEATVNRPPIGNASTIQFDQLPVGALLAMATAYPQTDARGTPLASGVAQLQVRPYAVAQASLTMATTIAYLAFTPAVPVLTVGDSVDMAVTAYDSNGSIVMMAPTKATWTISNQTVLSSAPSGFVCRLSAIGAGPVSVAFTDGETSKSLSVSLTVAALPITVQTSPALASVETGGTRQFTALVGGTADKRVVWSIDEGASGGTVSATGLYTAPATAGGPYHVRATSVADSTKSASAAVTVTDGVNTGNGEIEIR